MWRREYTLVEYQSSHFIALEAQPILSSYPDSSISISQIVLDSTTIHLKAEMITVLATCPSCRTPSKRVHARYVRRPMDLPWRGYPARLILTVRRFRCDNSECARRTFAEDCGSSLPRLARRTLAATIELVSIAMVAGGEAGSRLARKHHLAISPDTLLRLQRRMPLPEFPTPRVLGIDDFSLRRGQRYATIFVDLETHRPIDLVEGRDSEVVEKWLKGQSGIQVIVRDRSGAYAEGARLGAPQALQIADRFHLVQNASQALEEVLRSHRRYKDHLTDLADTKAATVMAGSTNDASDQADQADQEKPGSTKPGQTQQLKERVEQWREVKQMRQAGQNLSQIAQTLNLDRRTVRRYLSTPESLPDGPTVQEPASQEFLAEMANPRVRDLTSPILRPYVSYLQDRCQTGCFNASQLFREIVARGYTGSRSLLGQSIQAWRSPRPTKQALRQRRRLSVRWLVLRPPEQLKPEEKVVLDEFLAKNEDVARGYELLQGFRLVIALRDVVGLGQWQVVARQSELVDFVALANGIDRDRAAVLAALELPWSNGPVEGQITRVKLLKRQGYGRAKIDLLRRRVLAA